MPALAAFIADVLSRSDDAGLTKTPDTVADELTVIGIAATFEYRILHLIRGVGFTTGPPDLYPQGTRHTWSCGSTTLGARRRALLTTGSVLDLVLGTLTS